MKLKQKLQKWLGGGAASVEQPAPVEPTTLKVSMAQLARIGEVETVSYPVKMPVLPDGVVPASEMAMDSMGNTACS